MVGTRVYDVYLFRQLLTMHQSDPAYEGSPMPVLPFIIIDRTRRGRVGCRPKHDVARHLPSFSP